MSEGNQNTCTFYNLFVLRDTLYRRGRKRPASRVFQEKGLCENNIKLCANCSFCWFKGELSVSLMLRQFHNDYSNVVNHCYSALHRKIVSQKKFSSRILRMGQKG